MRRRNALVIASVCTAIGCGAGIADAASIGPGITTPGPLAPFIFRTKAGPKPKLSKTIAFVQAETGNQTELEIESGLKAGARAVGLKYEVASANMDAQTEVQDMNTFVTAGVGALVVDPIDPPAQTPVMLNAMGAGIDMDALVFGPATDQVNAAQYQVGKVLATAAATYIKTKLGGKANVVILNQDVTPSLAPRFNAIEAVLKTVPGAKIVANVTPASITTAGGYATMNTILQAHPHIDVVLGGDAVVLGALAALQANHDASNKQFLGGTDGTPQALAEILKRGPFKCSVALAPTLFGYAWSQFAARWLAGLNIPKAINVVPKALVGKAGIEAYDLAENHPATTWKDPALLRKYLGFYGSISYKTRRNYLAYTYAGQ
jgi:ribose transport system substrate-binding protein